MNFAAIPKYVEAHPAQSIAIGVVGVIAVLWLFGAFSKPAAASGDGGQSNMAAAYYAAEAQQAVVGGQIQMATIGAARDTAIAGLTADAMTKNSAITANAAMVVNGQNADATTTLGLYGLNATLSNNSTAEAINKSNNSTALTLDWMNNILPSEFALYGSKGFYTSIPGVSGVFSSYYASNPDLARASGFSEQYINQLWPGQGR